MARRPTESRMREMFQSFVEALGGWVAKDHNDVGGFQLNIVQGYYVIQQVVREGGGVSDPFGSTGRTPEEMAAILMTGAKIATAAKAIKRAELTTGKDTAVLIAFGL